MELNDNDKLLTGTSGCRLWVTRLKLAPSTAPLPLVMSLALYLAARQVPIRCNTDALHHGQQYELLSGISL